MAIDPQALLLLFNWMSPAFPVGGFAYSHGMEQAIADGRLATSDDVTSWIGDLLHNGSGWNDAVLFAQCWNTDWGSLNEIALALAGSAERHLETTQLGRSFTLAAAVWTGDENAGQMIAYPVAAGLACKRLGVPREQALLAYLQGFASSMVSVAVRLVPLGQTRGLVVLRDLAGSIAAVARRAQVAGLGDLGNSCVMAEIASMQHETLEPRIFRT